MVERLTRESLYELVWTEPIQHAAKRFKISDVALKKACAKAAIPTPPRGYWARKAAGKAALQIALPLRPPGMNEIVTVAPGRQLWNSGWNREELTAPVPPAPAFKEPLDAVRSRIVKAVGTLKVARDVDNWHPPSLDTCARTRRGRRSNALPPTRHRGTRRCSIHPSNVAGSGSSMRSSWRWPALAARQTSMPMTAGTSLLASTNRMSA